MKVPEKKLIEYLIQKTFTMNLTCFPNVRVEEAKINAKAVSEGQQSHSSGDILSYPEDSINVSSSSSNRTNNSIANNSLKQNVPNHTIKNVIHWVGIIIWCILDLTMKILFLLTHNWRILRTTIIFMYYKISFSVNYLIKYFNPNILISIKLSYN